MADQQVLSLPGIFYENSDSDDSEEEAMLLLAIVERRKRRRRMRRRFWVHPILQKRDECGEYAKLIQELRLDPERFHMYFRMSKEMFDLLLQLVRPLIQKQTTRYRKPISADQRLAVCLRFLGTGDSFTTIGFSFRMGITTVGIIVEETCEALWNCLKDTYMPFPTEEPWTKISARFERVWNFPNCIGALDGKHVAIQAPPNSGSLFYNYKGTFSIVLLALVDADYKFVVIDVGSYGSSSDGGIFSHSQLGKHLENGSLNVPPSKELEGVTDQEPLPHVIVGDEAFPLKSYLLRPYPGRNLTNDKRIFNYRLSRARRVSEDAFGLLGQRFRLYNKRMQVQAEKAVGIVKATCVLHNFLQSLHDGRPVENAVNNIDQAVQNIRQVVGRRPTREACRVRDAYKDYFSSAHGEVPWQYATVHRGHTYVE